MKHEKKSQLTEIRMVSYRNCSLPHKTTGGEGEGKEEDLKNSKKTTEHIWSTTVH